MNTIHINNNENKLINGSILQYKQQREENVIFMPSLKSTHF